MGVARELTGMERAAIRKLVVNKCANYDKEYGCLILESGCYMLCKCWTGSCCKYFRGALLPLAPALETALERGAETRNCAFCGKQFIQDGNWAYCSDKCKKNALRIQKRDHMKRNKAKNGIPPL